MDIAARITETRTRIDREKRLAWNETQIRTSMNNIASSLRDIHQNKLWEGKFPSFEEYCQQTWGMTRQRAYQILGAETTRLMLSDAAGQDEEIRTAAKKLNDGQAAVLEKVEPKQAIAVLRDAISRPGKMTANKIKQAKARVISTEANLPMHTTDLPQKANRPCPHCGGTGIAEEGD